MSKYTEIQAEFFSWQEKEKFWGLVDRRGEAECWPWLGKVAVGKYGARYGRHFANGQQYYAHRVAYVLSVGPIPDGLTLDHVKARGCAGGLCCNPSHTEPVSQSENTLRYWEGHVGRECPNGHGFILRGKECRKCRVLAVARTMRNNPEKYVEMKRLQKRKERQRKTERADNLT